MCKRFNVNEQGSAFKGCRAKRLEETFNYPGFVKKGPSHLHQNLP